MVCLQTDKYDRMLMLASKYPSASFIDSDMDDRITAVAFHPMLRQTDFDEFRLA